MKINSTTARRLNNKRNRRIESGQWEWGSSPAPSSGNLDGNCPSNPTPKFPYQLSPNNQNKNKNKKKKNSIEVKIVNGQIILRVTRDDMTFFIDEMTARKKIYHAPDFDVALPDNLDLEYVKSLSTKDRLKYLSDPGIRYSASKVCWRIYEKTWSASNGSNYRD